MAPVDRERDIMKIEEVCTMVFLAVNTGMDFRKKEISLYLTGIYACAGIIFSVLSQRELWDMLLPLAIGVLFLLFSFISKGALGSGDGWVLLALGLMMQTEDYINMICFSMIMAAGVSILLLTIFRKKGKTEIPFVPFIFLAYMGGVLL